MTWLWQVRILMTLMAAITTITIKTTITMMAMILTMRTMRTIMTMMTMMRWKVIKPKEVEIVKEVKTCVILCGDVFDLCTKVQWAPHIEGKRPSSMHKHLFQKCQSISIPNLRIMDSRWCLNGEQHVCIDCIEGNVDQLAQTTLARSAEIMLPPCQ